MFAAPCQDITPPPGTGPVSPSTIPVLPVTSNPAQNLINVRSQHSHPASSPCYQLYLTIVCFHLLVLDKEKEWSKSCQPAILYALHRMQWAWQFGPDNLSFVSGIYADCLECILRNQYGWPLSAYVRTHWHKICCQDYGFHPRRFARKFVLIHAFIEYKISVS